MEIIQCGMLAASQLTEGEATDVDNAPAPASYIYENEYANDMIFI